MQFDTTQAFIILNIRVILKRPGDDSLFKQPIAAVVKMTVTEINNKKSFWDRYVRVVCPIFNMRIPASGGFQGDKIYIYFIAVSLKWATGLLTINARNGSCSCL